MLPARHQHVLLWGDGRSASGVRSQSTLCPTGGAVRRQGVPDVIAMRISGHESRCVFDRYNIVSESDIEDALGRVTLSHRIL